MICATLLAAFAIATVSLAQDDGHAAVHPPPDAKPVTHSGAAAFSTPDSILEVKRIYVEQLTGGAEADSLRELIIASINGTKLFTLTDNKDRADAILKGAADDHAYTESFDADQSMNGRQTAGRYSSGSSSSRAGTPYGGLSAGDNESVHIKDRKHEAYASVRLCNLDGDVLWSTTQESNGAKFRGASADVAAKIARQLTLDVDRIRRTTIPHAPGVNP